MANVKPTKGGFVSCDCKTLSTEDPPTGAGCKCSLVSDIKKVKKFRIRRLKGITNVVVRKGPGRRKR